MNNKMSWSTAWALAAEIIDTLKLNISTQEQEKIATIIQDRSDQYFYERKQEWISPER